MQEPSADLVARFAAVVGAPHLLVGEEAALGYGVDWRKRYFGRPVAVARPGTTAEVAALVKICAETRTPIVPQGGNTGLVGGGVPDASGRQLVISLGRMNRVRAVDVANNTMTVEAGCVLANVQQAARDADRYFPLSLASEGSCAIGGNLATNAGGTAVLRYGNAREQVLGLEVVLPTGEIWDGLRGLRKDNTGYDLKQLFIGAEGTLGIITAAVLKMYPAAAGRATAVVALDTPRQAVTLLGLLQSRCGERLTGFELFSRICLDLVLRHFPATTDPFREPHPQYALIELSDTQDASIVRELLETALGEALDAGLIRDAALAASEAQSKAMWLLREYVSEAQAHEGKNIKHDVSLPASAIADFIERTDAAVVRAFPGARLVTFGHLGDGNLHYNVSAPEGVDSDAWMAHLDAVNLVVHDSVAGFNGSISAEHGLGQLKRDEIRRYKSPVELALMERIKAAVDPLGLMNPGKVI